MADSAFPEGLKPGDFIQLTKHFGDIFFEVSRVMTPIRGSNCWHVNYWTYRKYGRLPYEDWCNSASTIRRVVSAELAIPVFMAKRQRFHAAQGQYDPLYGFAAAGTPLRTRGSQ